MKRIVLSVLMVACSAFAGNFDGKWSAEMAAPTKKNQDLHANKKGVVAKSASIMLNLKAEGSQLTGTVSTSKGKRSAPMTIHDGNIDGDRFTSSTVQHGKKGDVKFVGEGTVTGEHLKGTRGRDGAKHGAPFTAKRIV